MRNQKSFPLPVQPSRESIVFSETIASTVGSVAFASHFRDECFVIAQSEREETGGFEAVKLACDTALWAYRHIRQRRFYWQDKKLFIRRIFRTVNLALWQQSKRIPRSQITALTVVLIGERKVRLGNVGRGTVVLWSSDSVVELLHDGNEGKQHISLGSGKKEILFQYESIRFEVGEILLVATRIETGLDFWISEGRRTHGDYQSRERLDRRLGRVREEAKKNSPDRPFTAYCLERVR